MFGRFLPLMLFTIAVSAHGYVHAIHGSNNLTTNGFLVDLARIVNGSQANAAIINSSEGCGTNVAAGIVDLVKELDVSAAAGLPTVDASGTISMLWRQVDGGSDGAGPGKAELDSTGTGQNFTSIGILKNFGDGGSNSDQMLVVQLPPGTNCSSGKLGNACLLRVTGGAAPFGSCLVVGSFDGSVTMQPSPTSASAPGPSRNFRHRHSGTFASAATNTHTVKARVLPISREDMEQRSPWTSIQRWKKNRTF